MSWHLLLQDLGIEESLERLDGCGTVLVLLCNRRGTADYSVLHIDRGGHLILRPTSRILVLHLQLFGHVFCCIVPCLLELRTTASRPHWPSQLRFPIPTASKVNPNMPGGWLHVGIHF